MKYLPFLFLLCFCSCMIGHRVMTMEKFYDIPIGMKASDLRKEMGTPYAIHKVDNSEEVYEYIERIKMGERTIEHHHYLFIIKNGVVTSKKLNEEKIPVLFQRNSYEMQTTDNDFKKP